MSEPKKVSDFVDEALAMCGVSSEMEGDAIKRIKSRRMARRRRRLNRLREMSAKRDVMLDDLERALLLQEFDPKAFDSGACSVSMRSKRGGLKRRDWTVTINGVDCNGLGLPDELWNSLMVMDGGGWKPRNATVKGYES